MGSSLRFAHLLGSPYVKDGKSPEDGGFDCRGICLWVNHLLGIEIPMEAFEAEAGEPRWEYLGDSANDATRTGDIIASCASSEDGTQLVADHVSVITSPEAKLAMSAHNPSGVFQVKTYYIANVIGAYRWIP